MYYNEKYNSFSKNRSILKYYTPYKKLYSTHSVSHNKKNIGHFYIKRRDLSTNRLFKFSPLHGQYDHERSHKIHRNIKYYTYGDNNFTDYCWNGAHYGNFDRETHDFIIYYNERNYPKYSRAHLIDNGSLCCHPLIGNSYTNYVNGDEYNIFQSTTHFYKCFTHTISTTTDKHGKRYFASKSYNALTRKPIHACLLRNNTDIGWNYLIIDYINDTRKFYYSKNIEATYHSLFSTMIPRTDGIEIDITPYIHDGILDGKVYNISDENKIIIKMKFL